MPIFCVFENRTFGGIYKIRSSFSTFTKVGMLYSREKIDIKLYDTYQQSCKTTTQITYKYYTIFGTLNSNSLHDMLIGQWRTPCIYFRRGGLHKSPRGEKFEADIANKCVEFVSHFGGRLQPSTPPWVCHCNRVIRANGRAK